jgi:sugar lactone lactonase YvrE
LIPDSKKITPVVEEGLSAPIGLACDGDGNIYVSDWGDAMCVKVFSPQGKLLRVDREEGRASADWEV